MIEIPERLHDTFVRAGWHEGRRVAVAPEVPIWHPAAAILAALGGLAIGASENGEQCAPSDVAFAFVPDALIDAPVIALWSGLLATRLVGVGEVHNGHGALLADADGRLFTMSLVHDALLLEGETFGAAVEGLLLGRRGRPLLRPDQSSVFCWGEEIAAGDPRVHAYRH